MRMPPVTTGLLWALGAGFLLQYFMPEPMMRYLALWPLGEIVKLDATVDRRVLRQQRDRLDKLGYEFAPLSQDWHLKAA